MPTADRAKFIQLQHATPEENVLLVVLIVPDLASALISSWRPREEISALFSSRGHLFLPGEFGRNKCCTYFFFFFLQRERHDNPTGTEQQQTKTQTQETGGAGRNKCQSALIPSQIVGKK